MPIDQEPPQIDVRDRHFACLRMHLQAENRHDMASTLATLSPDCAFEDIPMGRRFDGHEGAREYYELWWSAFAVTVAGTDRSYWLNDSLFVSEAIYCGQHIGPFMGVAATGNVIRLPFVVFVSFTGGLFGGERFYYDMATLLRQIGSSSTGSHRSPI
jgi:steroid delta-isomerase-like uncharacterized protein